MKTKVNELELRRVEDADARDLKELVDHLGNRSLLVVGRYDHGEFVFNYPYLSVCCLLITGCCVLLS
jgi:hypothetical protein